MLSNRLVCYTATKLISDLPGCTLCKSISTGSAAVQQPLHFLNGRRVEPVHEEQQDLITVYNPATGTPLRSMMPSGEQDVNKAVASAREAFKDWSCRSGAERGSVLRTAARLMRENVEELSRTETTDNGKPLWEARMDTLGCADSLDLFAGLAQTVAGSHISYPNHSFGYTRREPLGVIGAIGAFNYPLQMATWKSGPALATGNTIVFKPSPLTPLTCVLLGELYKEAGLPDGCYNVIQGEVVPGQLLSSHPNIAKMSFTGSVPTGSKIMQSCAKDIKHVTLELGGKSPLIIFPDCDLDNAVNGTMMANFLTQGQVCSNGTRVYVHSAIKERFLSQLVEKTMSITVGDPMSENTKSGAMISEKQLMKVREYIQLAKKEGAKVLCGGDLVDLPGELSKGWYIRPCVLTNVADHMIVAKEEIFGPVVSVLDFEGEEDVICRANDSEMGLASGVFTNDLTRAHRVAERLEAGVVYINNYNVYPPELPFGGYKKSGLGRECGLQCLEHYTQVKTVYVEGGDVWSPF